MVDIDTVGAVGQDYYFARQMMSDRGARSEAKNGGKGTNGNTGWVKDLSQLLQLQGPRDKIATL